MWLSHDQLDSLDGKRVALVHEWVAAYAGSEQVFEALAQMLPQADLYALSVEPGVDLDVGERPIRTTFLDRPWLRAHRSIALPLMPFAWWRLGRGNYDVVITSHHAFAHANRLARRGGIHLVYVHSPARYVWSPEIDERGASWWMQPIRILLKALDRRFAHRATAYAANSRAVQHRIKKYWGRDATVIYPPVRVEYFAEPADAPTTRDYVLGVGRFVPYKNLHMVIDAADRAGLPVKIAGRGPDKSRILQSAARAQVHVDIVESPNDAELRDLYRNAACLAFPTVEDFGIVPVEAQAAGTPIVAPAQGGALDTVVDGKTGLLVEDLDVDHLAKAIREVVGLDAAACRANAQRLSRESFEHAIAQWIAPR